MPLHHSINLTCLTALCVLASCSTTTVKTQSALDFRNPGRIEVQVTAEDPAGLPQGITTEITQNLAGWDYPVGAKDGQPFSHILKATVGKITHSSTPIGFSFSAGNSDPRSSEFQKADVLPISCVLTSIAHPEQNSELNLGFAEDKASNVFLGADKLADHISTVCFNLLSDVNWPKKAEQHTGSSAIKSPSWMPEIRIETKEVPVGAAGQPPVPTTDRAKAATLEKAQDNKEIEIKTVTPPNTQHRKQYIIYNKGAPVIFELGHERR